MDGFAVSVVLLCLAGIAAVVGANGYLRQAQQEFQSRLRDAALVRARRLLAAALLVWGGAGTLSTFATSEPATAAVRSAPPVATAQAEPVQLRLDQDINYAGR
jgi:hypothetical protein